MHRFLPNSHRFRANRTTLKTLLGYLSPVRRTLKFNRLRIPLFMITPSVAYNAVSFVVGELDRRGDCTNNPTP